MRTEPIVDRVITRFVRLFDLAIRNSGLKGVQQPEQDRCNTVEDEKAMMNLRIMPF